MTTDIIPLIEKLVLLAYLFILTILCIFGIQAAVLVYYYRKSRHKKTAKIDHMDELPKVTVQLPIFNEKYVARRLIEACSRLDYPLDRLEIQVLDDSTDETLQISSEIVEEKRSMGLNIKLIHRIDRTGYKAGALREGLEQAGGDFIAIFDADFVPERDFLTNTIPYFVNAGIGLVQTRWTHLNDDYSVVTKAEALALDAHFKIEQNARYRSGFFMNFNGTGGIWRKSCIYDAGNWQDDTITEDFDLSYRAQLRGWKFVFLEDVVSPAELPSEIHALKSQQYRWTKGAIETARKLLPSVWGSDFPLALKIQATFHLTNNVVFLCILIAALLNIPLLFVNNANGRYDPYFMMMAFSLTGLIGSYVFYIVAQRELYDNWFRRIMFLPLFMTGSMGFSLHNSKAILSALMGRKSAFVRTPKFSIVDKNDRWENKDYRLKIDSVMVLEIMMALYCLFGVIVCIKEGYVAAFPFNLMFFSGFAFVSYLSIKHSIRFNFVAGLSSIKSFFRFRRS